MENGRPAPDMIQLAMNTTGVASPAAVAKVGDSQIDIEEGQHADCGMTFGITTGAQTEEQLRAANPTAIIHSLKELVSAISGGNDT